MAKTSYSRSVARLIAHQQRPTPRPTPRATADAQTTQGKGHRVIEYFATNGLSGVTPDDMPPGFKMLTPGQLSGVLQFIDTAVPAYPDIAIVTFQAPAFQSRGWGQLVATFRARIISDNGHIIMTLSLQRQQAPTGGATSTASVDVPIAVSPDGRLYDVPLTYDDAPAQLGTPEFTDRLQLFIQFQFDSHFPAETGTVSLAVNVRPVGTQPLSTGIAGDFPQ